MTTLADVHRSLIAQMQRTLDTLANVLVGLTPEHAHSLRDLSDGPKGWTPTEVICHLRDFDGFFHGRAQLIAQQDNPQLPAYDHEALAVERRYNEQDIDQAYDELRASRLRFIAFFQGLDAQQWERQGIHPERGPFSLTDAAIQVVGHDLVHLEQLTRILAQR